MIILVTYFIHDDDVSVERACGCVLGWGGGGGGGREWVGVFVHRQCL